MGAYPCQPPFCKFSNFFYSYNQGTEPQTASTTAAHNEQFPSLYRAKQSQAHIFPHYRGTQRDRQHTTHRADTTHKARDSKTGNISRQLTRTHAQHRHTTQETRNTYTHNRHNGRSSTRSTTHNIQHTVHAYRLCALVCSPLPGQWCSCLLPHTYTHKGSTSIVLSFFFSFYSTRGGQ